MKKSHIAWAATLASVAALAALLGILFTGNRAGDEHPAEAGQSPKKLGADSPEHQEQNVHAHLLPEVPQERRMAVTDARILNNEATVPPQCYTKTEGQHNPCYTCHQMYDRRGAPRLNQLDDGNLQGTYSFSDVGEDNHWTNLFVDRREWLAQVSDEAIKKYVDEDNYSSLSKRLKAKSFKGFIPDLKDYHLGPAAFDERGLAKDGSGWVAINYKPFPGTFWPTNGATDDVLVRLPKPFRTQDGKFNRDIYFANLTLIELTIKGSKTAPIWAIDESSIKSDIDGDGSLATARQVSLQKTYFGDASNIEVTFEQFPMGTELMHSVRYLGLDDADEIKPSQRMKELRYMRKVNVLSSDTIASRYAGERKEKRQGNLPRFLSRSDEGLDNKLGWFIKGFIEDYEGNLRPQSFEEDMFCMGCHSAVGTTIDSTFSFARKLLGEEGFGYIDLKGMRDAPSVQEDGGEILNYLRRAGGGSEFRENEEMRSRWFKEDGSVDVEKVKSADVYTLIAPSARRALDLNKAYTHIVRHQSFIKGRDATWAPAKNVLAEVGDNISPLESEFRHYGWDLRLNWAPERPPGI